VDVWKDASRGDGDGSQQLAELLIIADGELDVAGDDAILLVVASGVSSQLEHLCTDQSLNGQPHGSSHGIGKPDIEKTQLRRLEAAWVFHISITASRPTSSDVL